jgi:hypothetical protein
MLDMSLFAKPMSGERALIVTRLPWITGPVDG